MKIYFLSIFHIVVNLGTIHVDASLKSYFDVFAYLSAELHRN
jgi:hypothetical protein